MISFKKAKTYLHINWIPNVIVQFCYLRKYVWALKLFQSFVNTDGKHEHRLKLENFWASFSKFQCYPYNNHQKLLWLFILMNLTDIWFIYNSTVAFRVWRVKVLNNNFSQEPITRSEQLPCARVTAFSRTSFFLERFWGEFWISFKFHKPVSKTYRPKSHIFCLLVTFEFPFWNFILRMPS